MNQQIQLPHWVMFIRIGQAFFALLTLALTAFAASVFGVFAGFGLQWFVCIWTFALMGFTFFLRPRMTTMTGNIVNLIGLISECFTAFWWLVTLGLIASEATALSSLEDFYDTYAQEAADDGYNYTYGAKGNAALGCTRGAAVCAAIEFVSFLVTAGLLILAMIRSSRAGNPNMVYNNGNGNGNVEPKSNFPEQEAYHTTA